jgi:hypothetical protein
MRLLNVDTYDLEELFGEVGNGIPEYAILSHTWGKEEVIFSDLQREGSRLKEGWQKIEHTCRRARNDGLKYVWMGTNVLYRLSSFHQS